MRDRTTHKSRGFAFVNFATSRDFSEFFERYFPRFSIGSTEVRFEESRAQVQGSGGRPGDSEDDWECEYCGVTNFKRRFLCFRCGVRKGEVPLPDDERYHQGCQRRGSDDQPAYDDVCVEPTVVNDGSQDIVAEPSTLFLIKCLDPLTTDDSLLRALIAYGIEVKEVRVIKDRTTSLSWGFGFVEVLDFESAMQIFSRQSHALMVDQRQVSIEYASPASFLVAYAPGAYTIPGLTEDGSVAYYTYWDQNAYATVAYGPRVKDEMEKRLSSVQPVAVQKAEAGFSNATIEKVLPAADTSSAKLSKTAVTKEQEAKMDQELDAFYDDLKDILGEETTNDATTTSSRVFDVRAVGREAEEAFISVSTLTCLLCDKHFKTLSDLRAHQDKNTAHARNAKDSKKIEKAKLRQQVEKRFIAESKQALKQQQKTKPSTSVGVAPKFGGHQIDLSLAAQPKISADSIGGQMLAKMGWTGGGLGKDGTGIVEPLTVSRRGPDTKLGVGATASDRFGSEEDELDMDIG